MHFFKQTKLSVIFIILLFNFASEAFAIDYKVLLLKSANTEHYEKVEAALRKSLAIYSNQPISIVSSTVKLFRSELKNLQREYFDNYDLLMTIGIRAAELAYSVDVEIPMLSLLIPKLNYQQLRKLDIHNMNTSKLPPRMAIYLDQPFERQYVLAKQIVADGEMIVFGQKDYATECGEKKKVKLSNKVSHIDSSLSVKRLSRQLEKTNIAIVTADLGRTSANQNKWLLYMAYQNNVPVIAYSQAFVQAGAIAAIFSTPAHFGKQAAEVILDVLNSGTYDNFTSGYAKYFDVALNQNVARSLGYANLSKVDLLDSIMNNKLSCHSVPLNYAEKSQQQMTQMDKQN